MRSETWVAANIKAIMLVTGALTCTMLYAAIAPQAALQSTFGDAIEGPLAEIVVRNWGVLIAMVGAMLIHGAFNPATRAMALTVAGASKMMFIGLVLAYGRDYLGHQAGVAIVVDAVAVALYVAYLLGARREEAFA